ncbi:undecaprenyl/decaprenyl-phosphate alpha-N-acetylglucosaminyl 1-phosphate transferase [Gammaproteobacteria bacterium LSUCC0057]|uniref:Undecaprenyl/decaprenyl-phosphate alpha-N-acetylglucosaminyl 1-phosphate transferase n=1 Tax=Gammaproteobacteria bacterium LSUCC0057 TaxID=2559237 RepID=A0A4Y8UI73_9GAMM|nr:undecaprenyl/decaprenyl-phosphate alpha-N-acetylglucosaminyl 1-phosphate transferase [Gammaproteobacteria bacterium LSUCC0057]
MYKPLTLFGWTLNWPVWQALLLLLSGLLAGAAGFLGVLSCLVLSWLGGEDDPASHGISVAQASRMGGSIIAVFLLVNLFANALNNPGQLANFYPAGLLVVLGFYLLGLCEDLITDIPPLFRLIVMVVLATVFVLAASHFATLGGRVQPLLSQSVLPAALLLGLSVFWLTLIPNAFNIADGANGLIAGTSLIVWMALIDIGAEQGLPILTWELLLVATLLFLIPNLLLGRLFLGDGGAYLLGACVAVSVLTVAARAPELTLYLVTLIFYPLMDLCWAVVRRLWATRSPFVADEGHLHNLLHNYLCRHFSTGAANSTTGISIALLFAGLPYLAAQHWGVSAIAWPLTLLLQGIIYLLLVAVLQPRAH